MSLRCNLLLSCVLCLFISGSARAAEFRPLPADLQIPSPVSSPSSGQIVSCDDGTSGGSFIQRLGSYYGNELQLSCTAGRLTTARFTHFGYGLTGPYRFRLHLFDASCRSLAVTDLLETPGAPDAAADVVVDLTAYSWCLQDGSYLFLEPLTCRDGLTGQDCYPALVVDATADSNPNRHCATVNSSGLQGRTCLAAQSADGRFFDFRLRAEVICNSEACTTAVEQSLWGNLKSLYR